MFWKWFIITLAIMFTSWVLPGIQVDGFWTAVVAAAVIGLLNVFIKPIILVLTLPLNILTLGLFTLVVNALLLELTAAMVDGFQVTSFVTAIIGALIISVVTTIFSL